MNANASSLSNVVFLSPHFTLHELIRSSNAARLGIDNTPTPEALANMRDILCPGLEIVRGVVRKPVQVNSAYRCLLLNGNTPGSSSTSYHVLGLAADILCPPLTAYALAVLLCAHKMRIRYDKLIYEFDWVHIQFAKPKAVPRLTEWTIKYNLKLNRSTTRAGIKEVV